MKKSVRSVESWIFAKKGRNDDDDDIAVVDGCQEAARGKQGRKKNGGSNKILPERIHCATGAEKQAPKLCAAVRIAVDDEKRTTTLTATLSTPAATHQWKA